jgi:hypothetical protein
MRLGVTLERAVDLRLALRKKKRRDAQSVSTENSRFGLIARCLFCRESFT